VLAVGDWKNQEKQKKRSKHANTEGVYFAYVGGRNPWTERAQILVGYRDPGRNHVCQIW